MTEKQESTPFASLWTSDFYADWSASLKKLLISSLEANEKMAKTSLARYEKAMAWTKDTPWAPWCKSMVTTTAKLIDDTTQMFCTLWHIDHGRDGPEKMSKV